MRLLSITPRGTSCKRRKMLLLKLCSMIKQESRRFLAGLLLTMIARHPVRLEFLGRSVSRNRVPQCFPLSPVISTYVGFWQAPFILLLFGLLCIIPSALKSKNQPKISSAFDSEHSFTCSHHSTKKTMPTIVTSKKELKIAVKESVREILDQELMKLRSLLLPFVSEKEQKEIERLYGKPSRKAAKSRKLEL